MDHHPDVNQDEEGLRLLVELGRGGMGTVYLALAQGPGGFTKLKVVKHLLRGLADDEQFLTLFMDEARLSAQLNHPNIVQTNEVGFDGRNYFIEMEYLEGATLEALTRRAARAGGVPLDIALYIIAQTLAGLHYAHEQTDHSGNPLGMVHRDVSPQNVFVTYEGAVKILDFGIAKTRDSSIHTRTGDLRGKVKYMAPEQAARDQVVDRRADIFAVGVMLWQLLTGQRLYKALSEEEVLLMLRAPEIPNARSIRPEVGEDLGALCAKALATRPDDRFATAEQFQVAIEETVGRSGRPLIGPRQIAVYVTGLFATQRAAVREEIDAQIRAIAAHDSIGRISTGIPLSIRVPAIRATATDPSRPSGDPSETSAERNAVQTKPSRPVIEQRRQSWRRVLAGLAATTGALVLAGGAFTITHRGPPPSTTTATKAPTRCATRADCVGNDLKSAWVCAPGGICTVSTGCSTNAQCTTGEAHPSLCNVDGRCVPFETEDCHVSAGSGTTADDESLWFGVLLPQRGEAAASFGSLTNSIELARRDFMESTNGLPSRHVGRRPRPIGLVICDDADVQRAAKHLVEELHVPAIVGFGNGGELVSLAPLFFAHDVLGVETASSNALVTSVPGPPGQPRLLWRTTGSAANEGKPLAAVVARLLAIPKPVPAKAGTEAPRVALVRSGSSGALSVAESFISELRINGRSITSDPTAFHQYIYQTSNATQVVQQLLDFRPAIVVALNSNFAKNIATPLEADWPKDESRPLYVFDGGVGPDDLEFMNRDPRRRQRYFAVDFPANTATNLKFALRYNEFFSPAITPGTAPGVGYDALFVLIYAAAVVVDEPITGVSLSRGIARLLPPGIPIDVGGAATNRAFGALREGKNIDLNGAGTPLNFDVTTGETQADYAVYCAHLDARGAVDDAMESGLRYSGADAVLLGEMRCP